jgi:hypothetical protein
MRKIVLFLTGMIAVVILALPASAELYKYIDNRGIVRYTDNLDAVPERYRSQIAAPAPEKPAVAEKPIPEPPARAVKAPEPGPSIAAPVAKPEIVVPKPKEPAIATEKPMPAAPERPAVAEKPAPPPPARAVKAPEPGPSIAAPVAKPEIVTPKQKKPAVVTAAREPAPEPSTLPKPEPVIDETKAAAEETFVTPAPVETAHLVPDTTPEPPDADIVILMEKRKSLLDQKEALDKTFYLLLAEKKALEAERTGVHDKISIRKYNENVIRLNERIKGFKKEDTALRDEIEYYNKLISQAQ